MGGSFKENMNTKHTPGPWYINAGTANGKSDFQIYSDEHNRTPVCQVIQNDRHSVEDVEANAHLIAAAPRLLQCLESILNASKSGNNGAYMGEAKLCRYFEGMAEIIISKAKGQA
jgi:hypothetical protein